MGKKEELASEYSFNIPSEIYNTLETDADRLLWKSETERAFEAGYDAGKQENEHLVWQISEANFEKGKEIGKKEIIDKACEWLENNLARETPIITGGYAHINFENAIKDFRKYMES